MERYDDLYRLYSEFDTATLRAHRDFVDLFPPVDARPALAHWQSAREALADHREAIAETFPADGEVYADIASCATRDQAFTALDLLGKYGRGIDVLVLDVDETLRSAGGTDNEIPRETLHLLTEFLEGGVPIVVCTGQTLENVKGFMIQGLGNELVHGGRLSIVYEAGTGVFTPGQGSETKALLYEDLDADIRAVFDVVRSRVLSEAPDPVRQGCHLQGNEFNVTLKPNFETGSERAREVIDRALVHQLDLLAAAVRQQVPGAIAGDEDRNEGREGSRSDGREGSRNEGRVGSRNDGREGSRNEGRVGEGAIDDAGVGTWVRAYYAAEDPEIRAVLEATDELPAEDAAAVPDALAAIFERIDVAYYEADAAEIGSLELNKVVGVERALAALDVADPFALVMGDSRSDLRVMRWVAERDAGIAAAPAHASPDVLEHVRATDDLVFDRGDAGEPLRVAYALDRLARLD